MVCYLQCVFQPASGLRARLQLLRRFKCLLVIRVQMEKSEADLSGVNHRQIVMNDPKTRDGSYLDADENDDGDLSAQ